MKFISELWSRLFSNSDLNSINGNTISSSGLTSTVCRSAHFDTRWYRRWAESIQDNGADLNRFGPEFASTFRKVWDAMTFDSEGPVYRHRKMWEWCVIAHALESCGKLSPNMRGCGFAVGHEPLASLFESPRVFRRPFYLSHAAMADSSRWR